MAIEDILKLVAKHYGVEVAELMGNGREERIARSRRVAMYVARKYTTKSLPEIAAAFCKSHAVIIHGVKQIEKLLETDAALKADVESLRKEVAACKYMPERISAPTLTELVCIDKNSDEKFTVHVNGDPERLIVEVSSKENETNINIWTR